MVLLIILECIIVLVNFITAMLPDASIPVQFDSILAAVFVLLLLLIVITLALFNANIIQFGVDQLQDSPADHQSLHIYWYVWVNYLVVFIELAGSTFNSVTTVAENCYIYITYLLAGSLLSGIMLLS